MATPSKYLFVKQVAPLCCNTAMIIRTLVSKKPFKILFQCERCGKWGEL